jgi:hypothetical protein
MTIPPVLLVLDVSALSAASPREWLEFSRVGAGYIPQAVYEEMRLLFDRSPDPDLERLSRAFNRFYPTSGWQTTDEHAHHSLLKANTGHAMTKRERVSLAVARCAYGLSQSNPASLVVLVSSDRALLQRLYDIKAINLCGITGAALLQWSRSGQRPIAVSQKLQQMRTQSNQRTVPPQRSVERVSAASAPKTAIQPKTTLQQPQTKIQRTAPKAAWFAPLTSGLGLVIMLAIAALVIWLLFDRSGLIEQLLPPIAPPERSS